MNEKDLTLTECDREPIRIPGAIQPHGYLLCLSEADLQIVQHSANLPNLVSTAPDTLVGQPVDTLLGEALAADLRRALATGEVAESPYLLGNYAVRGMQLDALVHR